MLKGSIAALALSSWLLLCLIDFLAVPTAFEESDDANVRAASVGILAAALASGTLIFLAKALACCFERPSADDFERLAKAGAGGSSTCVLPLDNKAALISSAAACSPVAVFQCCWASLLHGTLLLGAIAWLILHAVVGTQPQVWIGAVTLHTIASLTLVHCLVVSHQGSSAATLPYGHVGNHTGAWSSVDRSSGGGQQNGVLGNGPSYCNSKRWRPLFKDPTFGQKTPLYSGSASSGAGSPSVGDAGPLSFAYLDRASVHSAQPLPSTPPEKPEEGQGQAAAAAASAAGADGAPHQARPRLSTRSGRSAGSEESALTDISSAKQGAQAAQVPQSQQAHRPSIASNTSDLSAMSDVSVPSQGMGPQTAQKLVEPTPAHAAAAASEDIGQRDRSASVGSAFSDVSWVPTANSRRPKKAAAVKMKPTASPYSEAPKARQQQADPPRCDTAMSGLSDVSDEPPPKAAGKPAAPVLRTPAGATRTVTAESALSDVSEEDSAKEALADEVVKEAATVTRILATLPRTTTQESALSDVSDAEPEKVPLADITENSALVEAATYGLDRTDNSDQNLSDDSYRELMDQLSKEDGDSDHSEPASEESV